MEVGFWLLAVYEIFLALHGIPKNIALFAELINYACGHHEKCALNAHSINKLLWKTGNQRVVVRISIWSSHDESKTMNNWKMGCTNTMIWVPGVVKSFILFEFLFTVSPLPHFWPDCPANSWAHSSLHIYLACLENFPQFDLKERGLEYFYWAREQETF